MKGIVMKTLALIMGLLFLAAACGEPAEVAEESDGAEVIPEDIATDPVAILTAATMLYWVLKPCRTPPTFRAFM